MNVWKGQKSLNKDLIFNYDNNPQKILLVYPQLPTA